VSKRHGNCRYSERHELEMVSLYVDEERSLAEIEALTLVPYRSVWTILRRHGVQLRPPGVGRPAPRLADNDLIRTAWLHEQGLTYAQIGELLNLRAGGVKYRISIARERLGYDRVNRGAHNRARSQLPDHVRRAIATWRAEGLLASS
jgi:hypothetical protein